MRLRESRIYLSIESTIIATFLRVARRIGDIEFVENSWSFLQTSGSFAAREVAAEYCAATIAHGHDIRQIFLTILAHVHPPSRSVVVQDVLARLLVVDIEMGARVFAWAQQSHLTIDSNIIRELAMQIAARGNTVDALRYVDDPGLRVEHKLDVLASLLQCVVDPSRTLLSPRSFERSVSGLVRTQRPPSQPPRGLEESLLAALMVRRLSWLPRLIGAIQKFWPSFFSERFLILTAEEFVQQRQSWAALRLLHRSGLINADTQRTLMLKLVRTGAYKAAASMLKYPWPREGQLSISAHLLQLLRSSRKKPSRLLKVLGPWVAARTSAEVRLVSKVLAGYARSSQLFCTGTNDGVIQRNRIAIGNTIIYASVTRGKKRQARRVRHALAVFSKLREEQGFVPDRVTVNILLKAILHWTKAVDSQAVRALFDRMVRSGYPVSDSFSPGVGPFGMHSTSDIQFQVPELTSPILYAIHVRPLYKMFIKALYLRGDDQGARTIVGILKGLEARDRLARVQRIVMPMRNGRRG
ncbi:uncharacterized protein PHACADRAFT_252411 [Phanerochaete carnosa HHB-10118-sp]|uniref:Uncharacterized protein n=1 Tax=Phanerochaete carnosa (strain HHB-10118-sp) TaxID=650164 RepID=K5X5W0_PHACS|nr:uncharacterized protein PHACADRAFT_252411 [Phanerochaete carnosa HHB-10118-sp]EKM58237.1 hypothetical protein PHACADRAFT_252411 [Phanerochaete carnosa HHB-10118-sp]